MMIGVITMAKFKIVSGYGHVNDGKVYDEHPKFGHYKTPFVEWVCLVTGERKSKYYALSNLCEVKPIRHTVTAVDMGIVFTCAIPPRSIVLWTPTIELTPDLAANGNASAGVVIRVVQPISLFHKSMVAA